MSDHLIDPFKIIGKPSEWGEFGTGDHDHACDAERRAWVDHFIRRLRKGEKRGNEDVAGEILSGGSLAMAGLFISASGGPNALEEDAFDRWIAIMTFAWYQALSADTGKA